MAIEYSNFYLRANVHDFGLPEWVNRLTPLVEFNFVTPVTDRYGEKTIGTINPGIIWSGPSMQFSVEAIIPVTRATGKNVGIIAQLHFSQETAPIAPGERGCTAYTSRLPGSRPCSKPLAGRSLR